MLIDFHTHFFPDRLAVRTLAHLSGVAGTQPNSDGTLPGTLQRMTEWGVDLAVGHHIATKPAQQTNVNSFAASSQSERMLCFGSVHPDSPDAIEELSRIKGLGLRGVKLHPDYQGFFVDEERMFPIYEKISELGLPLLLHTGWDPFSPDIVHAPPMAVAAVCERFPGLTIIGAHMGGMARYDEAEEYLVGKKNLYLDTAMSAELCPAEQLGRMIKAHGADKVLFATDCPWSTVPSQLKILGEVGLTQDDLELITWKNAVRLLGL